MPSNKPIPRVLVISCYYSYYRHDGHSWEEFQWNKKRSHFDLKSWVTGGTKITPGIPSYRRIFESNWLDIESQFDSQFSNYSESRVEFYFHQWLNFLGQWLNFLGQSDSTF